MTASAQTFDQANDICNRLRAQFLHHPAALDLDRFLGGAEFPPNLLVEHPLSHSHADLALSQRQSLENGTIAVECIATNTGFL